MLSGLADGDFAALAFFAVQYGEFGAARTPGPRRRLLPGELKRSSPATTETTTIPLTARIATERFAFHLSFRIPDPRRCNRNILCLNTP